MVARLLSLARLLSVLSLSLSFTKAPQPRPVLTPSVWAARASALTDVLPISPLSPDSPADTPSFEDEVMVLVNQARWDNGALPPLKRIDLLDNSSETHSDNMAAREFFAHCDPDTGTLPWDRMQAAGYNWNSAAENIAAGYSTPAAVMTGWMNSSGHRANILSTSYRELGIGYVYQSGDLGNVRFDENGDCTPDSFNHGPYGSYWTQNFGRRNTVYPVVINREEFETTSSQVTLYLYGAGTMTEMRFQNESDPWSAWEPFQTDRAWALSPGNGLKTVHAELRNGSGTIYPASDTIWLDDPGGPSPTPSPLPTSTFTPTTSPSPSPTSSSLPGPSPTPTLTGTPGPSPTATYTATPGPSPTPTYTATPGPSPTPTLTATPFFWTNRLYLPVVRR